MFEIILKSTIKYNSQELKVLTKKQNKLRVLSETSIIELVLHYLSIGKRGQKSKICLAKPTNILISCDNNGIPLVVGKPQCGIHNNLYNINKIFVEMIALLEESSISVQGIFMNADEGFYSRSFKRNCYSKRITLNVKDNQRGKKNIQSTTEYFDDMLYDKNKFKIERTNA